MIMTPTEALIFDGSCHQVSCLYEVAQYGNDTAARLGVSLPSSLNCAVPQRKAEFVAGRYCASIALAQLDAETLHVGIGKYRQPIWPRGTVGSITHTHGYASAAAARLDAIRALGIDTETEIHPATAAHVGTEILTLDEASSARYGNFTSPEQFLTLVFSAKESLYKCLFPLTHHFFGFHAALITPAPADAQGNGMFRFELLENMNEEFRKGYSGHGRYFLQGNIIHTAVFIAA